VIITLYVDMLSVLRKINIIESTSNLKKNGVMSNAQ